MLLHNALSVALRAQYSDYADAFLSGKVNVHASSGSSGINIAGAIRLAKELGPGHTIVTILCDGGQRYQSRLYNRAWLAEKGLLEAADRGAGAA